MAYTNSTLVNHTRISPNRNSPRKHAIDTITIHCVVGQVSVETLGNIFANPNRGASSNYGIGYDGRVGMYVEERDRSWCSSSPDNDHRAVTIEVASDMSEPYAVTGKAYAALINLVADICKRNGIKKLVWSTDKNTRVYHLNGANMTVHRDFDNKSCPGTYLYNHHADIAAKVNAKLGAASTPAKPTPASGTFKPYLIRKNCRDPLNIRKGPGTNYGVQGQIKNTLRYTIVEERSGPGSAKGWGRLKAGGWVAKDWVKKV